MPKIKLTAKSIGSLPAINGKQTDYWDAILTGFGLRVSATERRSWVMMYRLNGKQRRLTLGQFPKISLQVARNMARDKFELIEQGKDPSPKVGQGGAILFPDLADHYMERYAKVFKKSWKSDQQLLKLNFEPEWKNRAADSITKSDVIEVIDKVAVRAPVAANRSLACIRKVFNWAVEKGYLEETPVISIRAPSREKSRDRVLTNEELKSIWEASGDMGWPWRPFFRLLILTMQRREEVSGMSWSELNLTALSWHLEGARTKNGVSNSIPLNDLAFDEIAEIDKYGSEFVFPAKGYETEGCRHISGFGKAKQRLDEKSGVTGWRIHDLRRTGASNLARLGVAPHIIEKILNHSSGEISGVAAIYNRYGYDEEKKVAMTMWQEQIKEICRGKGNVVSLERRDPLRSHS